MNINTENHTKLQNSEYSSKNSLLSPVESPYTELFNNVVSQTPSSFGDRRPSSSFGDRRRSSSSGGERYFLSISPQSSNHLESPYTIESKKINETLKINLKNKETIELQQVGSGSFSKVYMCSKNQPTLIQEIPNDQLVVKVLHEWHCGKTDPSLDWLNIDTDQSTIMLEKAMAQYEKLKNLFKDRAPEDLPFIFFYNPNEALNCGYSLYEKIQPLEASPIWDSTTPFEHLSDPQKKAYNSLLEMILVNKLYNQLNILLHDLASQCSSEAEKKAYHDLAESFRLELDLKWNNLGLREKENGEKQLVLMDLANSHIEEGIAHDAPHSSRNVELICSGSPKKPNLSIMKALQENQIAILESKQNLQDPYYGPLNRAINLTSNKDTISEKLKEASELSKSPSRSYFKRKLDEILQFQNLST